MTERERILRMLSSYDFAVNDLHIYLDTHPDDSKAAKALNKYRQESDKLRTQYEEKFGPLTTSDENGNRWSWISDPWPWDIREG